MVIITLEKYQRRTEKLCHPYNVCRASDCVALFENLSLKIIVSNRIILKYMVFGSRAFGFDIIENNCFESNT
jgi:hypothetical protein